MASDLEEALTGTDDLDDVRRALAREEAIRDTMHETGESRDIVTQMLDSMVSMGHEAVLDLVEGEPTTLRAGLARWLDGVADRYPGGMHADSVIAELGTLLEYPWPLASPPREELALVSDYPDDDHLVITLGGQEVAAANHDEHGWSGMEAVQQTAEAVHAAILAKLADVPAEG